MVPDLLLSGAAVLEVAVQADWDPAALEDQAVDPWAARNPLVVWAAARVASEGVRVDPWAARNPLVVWAAARVASEGVRVDPWAARNPPVAWAVALAALEDQAVEDPWAAKIPPVVWAAAALVDSVPITIPEEVQEDSAMQWRVAAHPGLPVSVVAVHKEAQVPEVV